MREGEVDIKEKEFDHNIEFFISILPSFHHSKETESRIHFYLGQSMFFQKRFSKALIEFLSSENDFKLASAYWIDKTLNEIKIRTEWLLNKL